MSHDFDEQTLNGVTRWCHKCGHLTFPGTSYNVCDFLV